MDLLGTLQMTKNNNQHIIKDRYRKLRRAVPMSNITAPYVASVLMYHRSFPTGLQNTIISNNGPQFLAVFYKTFCQILGIRRKTKTAYYPATNSKAKRNNCTVAPRL